MLYNSSKNNQNFLKSAMKDTRLIMTENSSEEEEDNPLLIAAKRGDAKELERLLDEDFSGKPHKNHNELKYTFSDLMKVDKERKSILHLAASIGNHETAIKCVRILLVCDQLLEDDQYGKYANKRQKLINLKDINDETALHAAAHNKAAKVVSLLIRQKAPVTTKSKDGVEAMTLVYKQVPEAMKEVYDSSVKLNEDFKSFSINLGRIIGYKHKRTSQPEVENGSSDGQFQKVPTNEFEPDTASEKWKETEYLSYILKAEKGGANLLLHPVVKYFVELKWKKIQAYFWVSFIFHCIWLLLYAFAFVDLHTNIAPPENKTEKDTKTSTASNKPEDPATKLLYGLWFTLALFTIVATVKEAYQCFSLRRSYLSFENFCQISFILSFFVQFGCLLAGKYQFAANTSVPGILLGTIVIICQMGKTPCFGLQVAALTKVIYSCKSHMFLFIVWFSGFGMAFWALFYKTEDFSILRMPAIVTGMAAGELGLPELMEKVQNEPTVLQAVSVFSLVIFIVVIVTLYLNLLIGYAVSDIQLLTTKAEVMELSNRLSTIYTVESFLLSNTGQKIVSCIVNLRRLFSKNYTKDESPLDCLYVIAPKTFQETSGWIESTFDEIPEKIREPLREIAYNNLLKK